MPQPYRTSNLVSAAFTRTAIAFYQAADESLDATSALWLREMGHCLNNAGSETVAGRKYAARGHLVQAMVELNDNENDTTDLHAAIARLAAGMVDSTLDSQASGRLLRAADAFLTAERLRVRGKLLVMTQNTETHKNVRGASGAQYTTIMRPAVGTDGQQVVCTCGNYDATFSEATVALVQLDVHVLSHALESDPWQVAHHPEAAAAEAAQRATDAGVSLPAEDGSCQLCDEPNDQEMGIFWDADKERNVLAHTQCGTDAGLTLA